MRSSSTSTAASARRLSLLALCATALSCAKPATQIAFRVLAEDLVPGWCDSAAYRNDPRCPASAYRIEQILVRVCRGGPCRSPASMTCVDGDLFCRTYVDSPRPTVFSLLPGDVTVAPSDPSAGGRVGISVIATVRVPGSAGDPPTREYIPRRFVVPFVPETTQLVEVWLTSLCIGALCPPETTCGRRSCEREDSPMTQPFTPLPPPGPVDGGDRDVSFDVRQPDAVADAMDATAPDMTSMDVAEAAPDHAADASMDAASDGSDVLGDTGADDGAIDADVVASDAPGDTVAVVIDTPSVPPADADMVDGGPGDGGFISASGASSVAAGGHHTCIVRSGDVWCWGKNGGNRLETAEAFDATPSRVPLPGSVQRVAVGAAHSCAWSPGGAIYCWGSNDQGQLGGGTAGHEPMRIAVSAITAPRDVAVGGRFTCAVDGMGAVYCWGANTSGQCGVAPSPSVAPTVVPGVTNARRVALGSDHACALTDDGAVWCWGANGSAQLGRGVTSPNTPMAVAGITGARDLFVGATHSCAVVADGVHCWGAADQLRLGASRPSATEPTPQRVPGITLAMGAAFAAGDDFSCAVSNAAGEVQCWGGGAFGQLGQATGTVGEAAPSAGTVGGLRGVIGLAAGARHACARTADGVFCWGADLWGQRGDGIAARPRAEPVSLRFGGGMPRLSTFAAGGAHACAVSMGAVWCWGEGTAGQLGNGQTGNAAAPVRASAPPSASSPTALCAGNRHTCAIYGDAVWCWGDNTHGALGNTSVTGVSARPVQVTGLPSPPTRLACGADHTCALVEGGADPQVYCWGDNRSLQLGAMGVTNRAGADAVGIAGQGLGAATATNCATQADGSLLCWGRGGGGELGTGSTMITSQHTPMMVTGVAGAAGVVGGARHFCAWSTMRADCWGGNEAGQLGRSTGSPFLPAAPGLVPSLTTPVVAMAAGPKHTCAIHGTALSCWGSNVNRECGVNGTDRGTVTSTVPLPTTPTAVVAGGRGGASLSPASSSFTCARVESVPWCWGSNEFGELGDGAAFSVTPMEVMLPAP